MQNTERKPLPASLIARQDSETLRRILNLRSPFAPRDRGNARTELVKRGIVVDSCIIADEDNPNRFRQHINKEHRLFETLCGRKWFGKLSSFSYELWDKSDCPECKEIFLAITSLHVR